MKKRVLSFLLAVSLVFCFFAGGAPAVKAAYTAYPVEGGSIYFDKTNGRITGCDESVTVAVIPEEIEGVAVTAIGESAFAMCATLEKVTIPYGVTVIFNAAFLDCSRLSEVILPDSLTKIGDFAFASCTGLGSIDLPDSVTQIGELSFSGCSRLTRIRFSQSMTSIAGWAFSGCSGLKILNIPGNITTIEPQAFCGCENLISVKIAEGVTSIGWGTFSGCHALKSIIIPESVNFIGMQTFICNQLKRVYFCGDAPTLGNLCFGLEDFEQCTYWANPYVVLSYAEGKNGWTAPLWNGYSTSVWDPDQAPVFDDVVPEDWYADAVDYAVENGLFNGMSERTFEPETEMTRAMLVTVLWRYAGAPVSGEVTFTDVPGDAWYRDGLAWAAEHSIVSGVGENRFDPEGNVTREQLATILYRYAASQGIDTTASADLHSFPDGNRVSAYAQKAMEWAVGEGLINGSDGKLLPQGNGTRAQVATILMRFIEYVVNN